MKLLFYRYGSICEPDMIRGFEELGLTVLEMTAEITKKNTTPQEGIQMVSNYLLEHPVDFVYSVNFYPFLSEVCNVFHIPYVSFTVDSPVMELYTTAIKNPWNRTFVFDYEDYINIHKLNPDCIFHLPLAANVAQKDSTIQQATPAERLRFQEEISFVGSLYTEKNPFTRLSGASDYLLGYLKGLMEAQLRIYGYYFVEDSLTDSIVAEFIDHFPYFYRMPEPHYLTDKRTLSQLYIGTNITVMERDEAMRRLSERFPVSIYTASDTGSYPQLKNKGLAKSLEEMPIIFHESKINLNLSAKSIRSGIPLRVWDILSSGGFCLTNYQSELPNYFELGRHLTTYASMEELEDVCDYYLHHTDEAKEIALCGYEYVKSHHTWTIRLAQLLQLAFSDK